MANQHLQKSVFHREENDVSNISLAAVDFKCPIMEYTYIIVTNTSKDQERSIEELSSRVTSSEDVKELLDHVNWRMFTYSCEPEHACMSNHTNSTCQLQDACSNSSCSFTNSTDDLFFFSSQCHNVSFSKNSK